MLTNKVSTNCTVCCTRSPFFHFCLTPSLFVSSTLDLDICFPNPCRNNGVCKDVQGIAKCDCLPPHKGPFCTGLTLNIRLKRLKNLVRNKMSVKYQGPNPLDLTDNYLTGPTNWLIIGPSYLDNAVESVFHLSFDLCH